jgi:hypothetical protein
MPVTLGHQKVRSQAHGLINKGTDGTLMGPDQNESSHGGRVPEWEQLQTSTVGSGF